MFRYEELSTLRKLILFKKLIASGIKVVSGAIASFVTKRAENAKSLKVALEPIQGGSGTPSPYNICPISGHTECVTSVSGVNVWDEEWEVGSISPSTGQNIASSNKIRSTNYIPVRPSTRYYIVGTASASDTDIMYFYDQNQSLVSLHYYLHETTVGDTFTTPSGAYYMRFILRNTTYNHDISINYPSTDTSYHAYDGNTYTTDLGRTVYGGTLDVVSGELTIDRAMVDLGSLTYGTLASGIYYATLESVGFVKSGSAICDSYPVTNIVYTNMPDKHITTNPTGVGNAPYIVVKDSAYSTNLELKTAMNGVQLVYELATPQTIQLTPTEVQLLLGTNNVWSDGGNVEVTYRG